MSTISNTNYTVEIRNKSVSILDNIINDEQLSRNVEKSIYNATIKLSRKKRIKRNWANIVFKNLYISKVRSIYTNLNKDTYVHNDNFLDKLKNGEIDPENIAQLSVYDIFPENWIPPIREENALVNRRMNYLTENE